MSQQINLYLCPATSGIRDAIHVPVISGRAGGRIDPGDPVKYVGGFDKWYPCETIDMHGVYNPFSSESVKYGDLLWVMLRPGSITDLQHVWTHPDFENAGQPVTGKPTTEQVEKSEKWLRNFCETADCPDYDVLIAAAVGDPIQCVDEDYYGTYEIQDWGGGDSYLHFSGRDAHGTIPPEFWDHVEVVTGRKCPDRPTRFSCSC